MEPFPTEPIEWYRGKRVLVAGASGLIGSYAVKLLSAWGCASLRAHTGSGERLGKPRAGNEYSRSATEIQFGDLTSPQNAMFATDGADVVVNCAGITGGVGLAAKDPVGYVGPATVLAVNMIHACHKSKVRLGFLSSTTVYAPSSSPVVEGVDDELVPTYPDYAGVGGSKRFLEKLCAYYHQKVGLEVAVVRPAGVYGRFDNFDESTSHVVPGLINRALCLPPGTPFEVWGDGQDVRDLVHAQDVAYGLLLATAKKPDATPYNIASGQSVTTQQMAETVLEAVAEATGFRDGVPALKFNKDKPSAMRIRRVSIEKAKRELGYEPKVNLKEGLLDVVRWLRSAR